MISIRVRLAMGIAVLLLCAGSNAAIVPCTCSGQDKFVFDSNGNHQPDPGSRPGIFASSNDAYWTFAFDDQASVFMIEGHGLLPEDEPGFHERLLFSYTKNGAEGTFQEILEHKADTTTYVDFNDCHRVLMVSAVLGASTGASGCDKLTVFWQRANPGGASVLNCISGDENKLGGVEGFPSLRWNAGDLAATGSIVDTNGDGVYDRRQGTVYLSAKAAPWVVNLLFDMPLEYYPSADDRQWLVIPSAMVAYMLQAPGSQPKGPFDLFIPLKNDAVTLTCGSTTLIDGKRNGAPLGRRLRRHLQRATGSTLDDQPDSTPALPAALLTEETAGFALLAFALAVLGRIVVRRTLSLDPDQTLRPACRAGQAVRRRPNDAEWPSSSPRSGDR